MSGRPRADSANPEERSSAAGHAAGYCWAENPNGRGRCTWPALPRHKDHKDVYAKTSWTS